MKNPEQTVSMPVVRRLPRYYRFLSDLKKNGIVRISSSELAARMRLTASQIRQDLNCFGGFGQQGYGYHVDQLAGEIERILYLDRKLPAIMVGVGNLGRALLGHLSGAKGIKLIGLFDKAPRPVTDIHTGLEVMGVGQLEDFCLENKPVVAILCIPGEHAQYIARQLAGYGIRGFWNFSNVDLQLPKEISVENVHLTDSILILGYKVNNRQEEMEESTGSADGEGHEQRPGE